MSDINEEEIKFAQELYDFDPALMVKLLKAQGLMEEALRDAIDDLYAKLDDDSYTIDKETIDQYAEILDRAKKMVENDLS